MAYLLKMCKLYAWQDISVLVGIAKIILPWTTKRLPRSLFNKEKGIR